MSAFKVGQRVKRARNPLTEPLAQDTLLPIGATGVVASIDQSFVYVVPDGEKCSWGCEPHTLEPLTDDPYAERFIESLKKLSDEPLILSPEETLQIAGGQL